MSRSHRRPAGAIALAVLAVVATACGTPANEPTDPATPTPSPVVTPTDAGAPGPLTVDLAPGGAPLTLDNGWSVQHCEGDAPFLCVRDAGGTVLGTVEFASYAAGDAITRAVAEGTVADALRTMAEEQHELIEADRAQGCGPTYEYRGEPVRPATVNGAPAALYAFSGVVGGREVERQRSYYTVHRGQVWVLSAPASDPEGCMASDLGEFTPADLATFEPYLERLVAGSALPEAGRVLVDGP